MPMQISDHTHSLPVNFCEEQRHVLATSLLYILVYCQVSSADTCLERRTIYKLQANLKTPREAI